MSVIFEKSGDPGLAERQWRVVKPLLDPHLKCAPGAPVVLSLLGNSRFLVDFLVRDREFDSLIRSPCLTKPKGMAVMKREIRALLPASAAGDLAAVKKVLRQYKLREMARIAARDLSGNALFEEIGQELADLAAVEIGLACESALPAPLPFAVVGLGKLGGEDLNFSSDIDLIYLYGTPENRSGSPEEIFKLFAKAGESITHLLNDRTEDGVAFRVDLDLRPEGKNGPLVNSLESMEAYYETMGAPWERAALTKARPVAGQTALGDDFLKTIEPFVCRRSIDFSIIGEIKEMKDKINAGLKKGAGFNVKLGKGGIREVEFFVTAFQLIYGGKEKRLRERNTLKALALLDEINLVPSADAQGLREAYIFLRRIENRLQMADERQVHRLPSSPDDLLVIARQTGFEDTAAFMEALEKKTRFVAGCFERLAA